MTYKLFVRFFFALMVLVQFSACSDNQGDGPVGETVDLAKERFQMANDISSHFIFPAYANLSDGLAALMTRTEGLGTSVSQEELDGLRADLKTLWLAWQEVAPFQFGPMVSSGLRSAMNIYPVDPTLIEQNIAAENYDFGTLANQEARGMPAIDYLINRETSLSDFEDPLRRTYLEELLQYLSDRFSEVSSLNDSYFPNSFDAESQNGTDVGSATSILINGMDLHFQRYLRDGKVAIPAGVRSAGVPRPTTTEAFYGACSVELLVKSLNAYLKLFRGEGVDGNDAKSLSNYLGLIEQKQLADDIEALLEESIQKANALNDPLSTQIDEDVEKVTDLFLTLQQIVTLMKSDMASVIGITLTNVDTDGD